MILAWYAALAAQSVLAYRTRGPVRHLHAWQVVTGVMLMGIRAWQPSDEYYGWAVAVWWIANAGMLVYATAGRFRPWLSASVWCALVAVAVGSSVHFDRDPVTVYSLRWIISTVAISHWLGAAWPDRWMLAYALLSYAHALAGAWVWFSWLELYVTHQWAQSALFAAWAWRGR